MTTPPSLSEMLPKSPSLQALQIPLTIIVATTPSLGIGYQSRLPWPQLKAEMSYFARITKRRPPQTIKAPTSSSASADSGSDSGPGTINAVLMGRTTYESIPPKFRPLKDRLNIVLTRAVKGSETRMRIEREEEDGSGEGPIVVGSISEALSALRERFDPVDGSTAAAGGRGGGGSGDSSAGTEKKEGLGRVFVIGGAEVYAQALKMPECERVLRTRIEKEFECDVFFSERLDGSNGWRKSGKREFDDWVGETVPEWLQRQGDVEWEYEMWERNSVN